MTSAVVVLSGGQDSATCLFWALERYDVKTLTFAYGQRHETEVGAAERIAKIAGVPWKVVSLGALNEVASSALTRSEIDVSKGGGLNGLPSTFVPGRNLVFLTLSASYALSSGADRLVTGVCQTDYSGYPDCRRETIDALETAIYLGNRTMVHIETPLMYMSKAKTVKLAMSYGEKAVAALRESVTCYHGQRPGCESCPSCVLRAKGFAEAGFPDPAYS